MTPTSGPFKIWYIHQVPGERLELEVPDPVTGKAVLEVIYQLMACLRDILAIPDYASVGGILCLDEDGDWVDYDEEGE